MNEYIEVDYYVGGVYRGKRKIDKQSIVGALLSGSQAAALDKFESMIEELNQIPGVQASIKIEKKIKDEDK